jgi:hypothetical protein
MGLLQNGYYLYSVSAFEYFNRARENIDAAKQNRHYLFYAALETRFLIETILREYLVSLRGMESSRGACEYYEPNRTIKAIQQAAKQYFVEKVQFVNVLLESGGVTGRLPVPDFAAFRSHYKALNNYLHTRYLPTYLIELDWWQQFENELLSSLEFTCPFLEMPKIRVTWNPSGLALFHRFRRKEISNEELLKIARNNLFDGAEIRVDLRQFPQE